MSTPTHSGDGLTLGPVQMLVVGFEGDNFTGEIREELQRLKENDVIRLIDLLFVRKNDDGEIEVLQTSDLDQDEAEEFGAIVGALVGFGAGGEEEAELGAIAGAAELEDGHVFDDDAVWYLSGGSDRAPLGDSAAGQDCASGRPYACRRVDPRERPPCGGAPLLGWEGRRGRRRLSLSSRGRARFPTLRRGTRPAPGGPGRRRSRTHSARRSSARRQGCGGRRRAVRRL